MSLVATDRSAPAPAIGDHTVDRPHREPGPLGLETGQEGADAELELVLGGDAGQQGARSTA